MNQKYEIHYDKAGENPEAIISVSDIFDIVVPAFMKREQMQPEKISHVGKLFTRLMRDWDKEHNPKEEFGNPYAKWANDLDPQVGGS